MVARTWSSPILAVLGLYVMTTILYLLWPALAIEAHTGQRFLLFLGFWVNLIKIMVPLVGMLLAKLLVSSPGTLRVYLIFVLLSLCCSFLLFFGSIAFLLEEVATYSSGYAVTTGVALFGLSFIFVALECALLYMVRSMDQAFSAGKRPEFVPKVLRDNALISRPINSVPMAWTALSNHIDLIGPGAKRKAD
jgi:hypothetical protein